MRSLGLQSGEYVTEKQIPYLNASLLYGESGTGKTTFGRYATHTLDLPFAYVNFSGLIDSYLGSTSKNLTKIFDYLQTQKCLIMLDEVDAIGLKRGGGSSGAEGELARTTITLMQELDKLTNEHILIAATNRYDRLDPALKRRFTVHHEIVKPTKEESVQMVKQYLASTDIPYEEAEVDRYATGTQTQAQIMTDLIQAIADYFVAEETVLKL